MKEEINKKQHSCHSVAPLRRLHCLLGNQLRESVEKSCEETWLDDAEQLWTTGGKLKVKASFFLSSQTARGFRWCNASWVFSFTRKYSLEWDWMIFFNTKIKKLNEQPIWLITSWMGTSGDFKGWLFFYFEWDRCSENLSKPFNLRTCNVQNRQTPVTLWSFSARSVHQVTTEWLFDLIKFRSFSANSQMWLSKGATHRKKELVVKTRFSPNYSKRIASVLNNCV